VEATGASYEEPEAMRVALANTETFFTVSAARLQTGCGGTSPPSTPRWQSASSGTATSPSSVPPRDQLHTEKYARAFGVRYTLLRDGLYLDVLPAIVRGLHRGTLQGCPPGPRLLSQP
jgi:hypothetical protein